FFTNPVLGPEELAGLEQVIAARRSDVRVPTYPALAGAGAGGAGSRPGVVKGPAAWLIEQAGLKKGYPGHGPARTSSKHALALTNAGGASAAELIHLAREIAAGVRSEFGIELAHEPVLVGLTF